MYNRAGYQGRLTQDPFVVEHNEVEKTAVYFKIAVQRDYKLQGRTPVDYISCEAYSYVANAIAKWVKKGQMIVVDGKTVGKSDNRDNYVNICRVESFYFTDDGGNTQFVDNKKSRQEKTDGYNVKAHPENVAFQEEKPVKVVKDDEPTTNEVTEDDLPY